MLPAYFEVKAKKIKISPYCYQKGITGHKSAGAGKKIPQLPECSGYCGIYEVELQGIEPWSKHIRRKPSTCLFSY